MCDPNRNLFNLSNDENSEKFFPKENRNKIPKKIFFQKNFFFIFY